MEEVQPIISIIVADDHAVVADGITDTLEKNNLFKVVGTVCNGEEVIALLKKEPVDIVIMDIRMPIMDGIEATEIIAEYFSKTKVLIVSMHNKGGYIQNAMEAGANGYLLKNANRDEMEQAIISIVGGGSFFSQEVSRTMAHQIISKPDKEEVIKLSRQEKNLLKLLSEGYTNDEVSVKMKTNTHAIRSYRRIMMAKFNAKNNAELVSIAFKKGYIL